MALSEIKGKQVSVKLWTPVHEVESQALDQLKNIASLPWVAHHVAVMPDVHYGKGATVGSVIAMRGAVSPAAVGVDIGCGMAAVRTSLKASDLPDSLKKVRERIEAFVPVGFNSHENDTIVAAMVAGKLFQEFKDLHEKVQDLEGKAWKQVGTLGGGNHFIELCLDEGYDTHADDCVEHDHCSGCDSSVWIMLHSGSRNIGKTLAEIHMWIAKGLEHNHALQDRDLAVFLSGTPEMAAYRRDLFWAQRYAYANREAMLAYVKTALQHHFHHVEFDEPILCHHNYVSEENHFGEDLVVTRKGAISAKEGEMGIIPGSMGTRSYIVRGLGNPESFCSASHGAGRRMSRGAAKRKFTTEDLIQQTEGVECRKDEGVIDEIPGAYKSIEQVMQNQSDLVEIVHELRQVLCVKG